jgi:hypothetical protein
MLSTIVSENNLSLDGPPSDSDGSFALELEGTGMSFSDSEER